ncbi:MAG: branched-chain-amino-acid transaminase [Phycisphaerae bacterium]|nr:branched-chain-amino-acid transaminase [Phycisphaerae bacterium]
MSKLVWIDGQRVPLAQAKISVFDHGLLYGDGVFEGLRQYNGRIFRPQEHLDRLFDSARAIRLEIPYSASELLRAMEETLTANAMQESYIRLVVTRGVGLLGISPANCQRPTVFIITDTIQMYPAELYRTGMAIITASTVRTAPNALSPKIKSLNYLNNILAKWEAIDAGVPEAVMLNHLGYVCECTGDNIFIVRGGELITPPPESGLLVGITRGVVIELAGKAGIPVRQTNLLRSDLYTADECFLTGSGAEVIAVTSIDKRPIGFGKVGPMTEQLSVAFHHYARHG